LNSLPRFADPTQKLLKPVILRQFPPISPHLHAMSRQNLVAKSKLSPSLLYLGGTNPMRAQIILAVTAIVCCVQTLNAQVRKFPYEAKVVVDEVYVRSGSGNNSQYYATQKLSRDAVVTVRRHEPGGWVMIDPPQGSFSWVPARYVDRQGDEGVVKEDNVVAFVGSNFGDEAGVWQRPLRAGERVTILGERQIDTQSGMQQMYQITPPSREFRWMPGAAIVPIDENVRKQLDNNPYAMPSQANRTPVQKDTTTTPIAGAVDTPPVVPSTQLARLQSIRSEQKDLADIDHRFREMILLDPSQWNLDGLEDDYRRLQEHATYRPVSGQIDLRYPAINRYRQRQAEFTDFQRLTSQTEQRDAELLADQRSTMVALAGGVFSNDPSMVASMGPESMVPPGLPPNLAQLFAGLDPTVPAQSNNNLVEYSGASDGQPGILPEKVLSPESARSRYVGAGIIAQSADDSIESAYVLKSTAGQVLAHLKPNEDVDLESYVGKSVGLHGSRWFKDDIQSDYIEVSGLEQVQLRR
jgi:hypothetical protein